VPSSPVMPRSAPL